MEAKQKGEYIYLPYLRKYTIKDILLSNFITLNTYIFVQSDKIGQRKAKYRHIIIFISHLSDGYGSDFSKRLKAMIVKLLRMNVNQKIALKISYIIL